MAALFRVLDNGTLRTITRLKVKVAGVLRSAKTLKVMDGGVLRTVGIFADPLSVTAPNASGSETAVGPTTVTATSLATPAGGIAPYTYLWTKLTGAYTLSTATSATGTFSEVLSAESSIGSARVTVTDAEGQTATADIVVSLEAVAPEGP